MSPRSLCSGQFDIGLGFHLFCALQMRESCSIDTDVSVIVVTFNSADCVQGCLESILAQEALRLQVIVVDNASTDNTVSSVRRLGKKIRLLRNTKNVGFGRACNRGFAASQG